MPIRMSLFSELVMRDVGSHNEAACRHMADEGPRGRHDARLDGPPLVSEAFLRHRALQQEAGLLHLSREARRAQREARPDRVRRGRPVIVRWLRRAWWWRAL